MNSKILKLFALVLAIAMIFSFAACSGDDEPTTTTSTTAADEQDPDATQEPESSTELTSADITDATAPSEDASLVTEDASATDTTVATSDTTTKADGKTTTAKADGKTTTTKADGKVTTTKAVAKVDLSSTQKILDYYAAATAKAMLPKAGFKKTRSSTLNGTPDVPWVLEKLGATELVEEFMGIGEKNKYEKVIKKGETDDYKLIQKSTLTTSDIKSASFKPSGDGYVITIKVKDGNSYADKEKKTNNSPIEKCGICVGNKDKSQYDHKNALVMYDAVDGTLSGAKVLEKTKDVVVTATINANGQLTSLKVTFGIYTDFSALGAQIIIDGKSTVTYSNFKY